MNNFHCKACGLLVKHNGRPTGHCDKSGSGNHDWKDLGEVGDTTYKCKACGLMVDSDTRPNNGYCEDSGSKNHQWEKL